MKKESILIFFILLILPLIFFGDTTDKSLPPAPKDIEKLFDNYCRELVKLVPEYASRLGINKNMGYEVETDQLNDESEEKVKKWYALKGKYRQWLNTYDRNKLTPSQRRAANILIYALDLDLETEKFQNHFYIINHMTGFHNQLTTLMSQYHTIENLNHANAYITRLGNYKKKFLQISNRLEFKEKTGFLPPAHIIKIVYNEMSNFIDTPAAKNVLYASFRKKLERLDIDMKLKEKLCRQVKEKIETVVYPAYRTVIEQLKGLKKKASSDAGAWKLPGGDEYYKFCLRFHTGTSMTPEQIHKKGRKEVRRIQKEIRKRLAKSGFIVNLPFRQLVSYFWQAEASKDRYQLYYPNTHQGRMQALQDFKKHLNEITLKIPQFFSISPQAKLIIKPVPQYKEHTMITHYVPLSLDKKGGGILYINLSQPPFKPAMKTLAVHEGIPGHHFQMSIERESPGTRMFRNFLYFASYTEGWALYVEKLAMDSGWFEDLYSQMGYLNSQLLKAVRVVLDTGIHYRRWSRTRALSYMRENVGWESTHEIDRYIVWPGQACAYKIGELKILELRERAKKKLKDKFDIREFHTVVLEHGSVPLPILETFVNDYIAEKQTAQFYN
ncbi:MAG: DUF885 family protein [Candidatus Aminicenantes bacterium]|nr:DUF885 family protein [Candidatus Aminicenantes bacterium]NIM82517.1 DUF885 family protein [Candidatus Aminicenantes bacterium]NIN21875.1 DUF885 family protein [Candidatus Aminicenantes bacterium]NIN45653.1 DUF885 family protein [Candidatus Aminicenantes bacterium]NIN88486.1 DUF885 family protein [Candidatus Aminicenantes bacterium]